MNLKGLLRYVGPGLLFASTAIGTSHLVLSTRAGAHHGLVYLAIVLAALIVKYPFFEIGPRYTSATGFSLLNGYKNQGKWAVLLFLVVICINMFAVTGALSAVCGGLLSTVFSLPGISMAQLVAGILLASTLLLLLGRYTLLDRFIKLISLILLVTVCTAFIAVVIKGPNEALTTWNPNEKLLEGTGLVLLVSLVGFMPSGMETSAMHSIWVVEKIKSSNYTPSLKECLFDFKLGYFFTSVLALMFVTIGAFTIYGTGTLLQGNSTEFSAKLLGIFTTHLGAWTYPVIALAAFGTIYGTLIAAFDAFARSFVRGLRIFKFKTVEKNPTQDNFLTKAYNVVLPVIGLGAFMLFYQFTGGMIKVLEFATIAAFLGAPVIAWLNLRAIQGSDVSESHRLSRSLIRYSYLGLILMVLFSGVYLYDLLLG